MERWFFRCAKKKTCGHKWAVEVPDSKTAYRLAATMVCPKCGFDPHPPTGASYSHYPMGKVSFITSPWRLAERARLVQEKQTAACDGRCTHAKGHVCECECGGMNHGTGKVITWRQDVGAVPVLDTAIC